MRISPAAAIRELARRGLIKPAAEDPVEFAARCGYELDEWQARVARSESRGILLNCSRQAGKSRVASIIAMHRAVSKPGSLILLVSPSDRQSTELFLKVQEVARAARTRLHEDNKHSMRLANGSRIVSLPSSEDTIRGFSAVELLLEDEAAYVSDALHVAVRPMLAVSRGQHIMMSSPAGLRGHFFEAWERGGDAWERVHVTCWNVARFTKEFLEAERRAMGIRFQQEYEARFIAGGFGCVYSGFKRAKNTFDAEPQEFVKRANLTRFILSMDFGVTDPTAFAVLGWAEHDPTVYVLESYKRAGMYADDVADEVQALQKRYEFERIVGDLGGLGKLYGHELAGRRSVPIEPADKVNKYGYVNLMNGAFDRGAIKANLSAAKPLVEEWESLPWDEDGRKEVDGVDNHCADAALYGWRACLAYLEHPEPPKPKPGTPEHNAAIEAEIEQELDRQRDEDPWVAMGM